MIKIIIIKIIKKQIYGFCAAAAFAIAASDDTSAMLLLLLLLCCCLLHWNGSRTYLGELPCVCQIIRGWMIRVCYFYCITTKNTRHLRKVFRIINFVLSNWRHFESGQFLRTVVDIWCRIAVTISLGMDGWSWEGHIVKTRRKPGSNGTKRSTVKQSVSE